VQGALLAAGHAGADEVQPVLAQRLLAAAGVGVVRVAAVDHDVARLQQRHQLVDDRVGRPAGLHHHDDRPGPLQRGDEVGHRLAGQERALVAVLGHQAAGALDRPVVQRDREAVPGEIAGQVAPHDRQPGHPDLRCAPNRSRLLTHPATRLSPVAVP
jgi:hypothetical protein